MTVQKLVGEFGAAVKPKLAGGGQPEDQLRGPLENLLHGIAQATGKAKGALTLTGEKSLADLRTRPDYAVSLHNALIGFIEVKAPGKGADPRHFSDRQDKEQWERLKSLPNLLYTDGNSFGLYRHGVREGPAGSASPSSRATGPSRGPVGVWA